MFNPLDLIDMKEVFKKGFTLIELLAVVALLHKSQVPKLFGFESSN